MANRARDYKAEYQRRIQRGLERGLTTQQARGHGKGESAGMRHRNYKAEHNRRNERAKDLGWKNEYERARARKLLRQAIREMDIEVSSRQFKLVYEALDSTNYRAFTKAQAILSTEIVELIRAQFGKDAWYVLKMLYS